MFLKLKNIEIGYQTPLVKGINTSLDLGEVVLLMGNNGVGKTTLIKSILHQIPLLSGQIFIQDQNVSNLSTQSIAEKISVVFSKAQIPFNYTTKDLIALGKYIHYPYYFKLNKKDNEEINQIINGLKLEQYKNTPLVELSDGNLQKAFIGRALAQNSPMIILDEPTTHLDEDNKIMILNLIRNLAKEQRKLILFSSHDWRLAKDFSDKIWWINQETLFAGFAEEIIEKQKKLQTLNDTNIPNLDLPTIIAPADSKALLVSFLKKHSKKNLKEWTFTSTENQWTITTENKTHKKQNWKSIIDLIS